MFHGVPRRLGAATLVLQTRPGYSVQVSEWHDLPVTLNVECDFGSGMEGHWRSAAPPPPKNSTSSKEHWAFSYKNVFLAVEALVYPTWHWLTSRTHVASRVIQPAQVKPPPSIFQELRGTFPIPSWCPHGFRWLLEMCPGLGCLAESHLMEIVKEYGFSIYQR